MSLTVQQKADRWDALMSCQRIRVLGYAALGDPQKQHIGLELWARYPNYEEPPESRKRFEEFIEAMLTKKETGHE